MDRRETTDRESTNEGNTTSNEANRTTGATVASVQQVPSSGETSATQSFYGRWARVYDLIATWLPGIRAVRRSVAAACLLERGDTVVELGCGTGSNLRHLRERVGGDGTVIGVDVTPDVLELARRKTVDLDNVYVIRGDATQPPLDPGVSDVDAVVATFLVGMLPSPAATVSRWCDLVGPGGRVVLANASPTDHWAGPILNRALRLFVACSTPPMKNTDTGDPAARLENRVDVAHQQLRDRSRATIDSTHSLGLIRLTGGIVGEEGKLS